MSQGEVKPLIVSFQDPMQSLSYLQAELADGADTVLVWTAKPDGTFKYMLFTKEIRVERIHWWATILQQWCIDKFKAAFGGGR